MSARLVFFRGYYLVLVRCSLTLVGFGSLVIPSPALTWFTNDTVISTTINDDIRIGDSSHGKSPTVTLTNGGVINGGVFVDYGVFNIAGGLVDANVGLAQYLRNFDRVNMTGGTLGALCLLQNSYLLTMSGGTVNYRLQGETNPGQTATVSGGYTQEVNCKGGQATIGGSAVVYTLNTSGASLTRVERGALIETQIIMSSQSTNHVLGGLKLGAFIQGEGAARCFLYGTNWNSTQTGTNVVAFGGNYDKFRITGITADGTKIKNLDFYRKVGSAAEVSLVNTNISFPLLNATVVGPDALALSWHYPSWGYVLQSAPNLDPPGTGTPGWQDVATTPTQSGSNNVVIVNSTNAQALYRLISR